MAYLASFEDAENDPDIKVIGRPQPGLNANPFVAVESASELPTLPPELIDVPSVSITIEAPDMVPDRIATGELTLPEPMEVASISVNPAPEPNDEEF